MIQLKNIALLLASATAFTPRTFQQQPSTSSLGVSVVSEFIASQAKQQASSTSKSANDDDERIQSAFETESPEFFGVMDTDTETTAEEMEEGRKKRKPKRKHNYSDLESFLKEVPDLDFYTLHSSAVSHLYIDMPINDIIRAIKRAQNRHDNHDLKTIGAFLMDECDEHWGYGFRGTLLSRLAVAALHTNEVELAIKAIETRAVDERPSIKPFESTGIVRGLLRAGLKEEGWKVLEDELRLPLQGTALDSEANQELIKHRAHALSSFASRFFYAGESRESERALQRLGELGTFAAESHLDFKDLNMPWTRLEDAASACNKQMKEKGETNIEDLREMVWEAMMEFPCPGEEEECSLNSYFMTP